MDRAPVRTLKSVEGTSLSPPGAALPVPRAQGSQRLRRARPSSRPSLLPGLVCCVCHRKSQAAGEAKAPEDGTRLLSSTPCRAFSLFRARGRAEDGGQGGEGLDRL